MHTTGRHVRPRPTPGRGLVAALVATGVAFAAVSAALVAVLLSGAPAASTAASGAGRVASPEAVTPAPTPSAAVTPAAPAAPVEDGATTGGGAPGSGGSRPRPGGGRRDPGPASDPGPGAQPPGDPGLPPPPPASQRAEIVDFAARTVGGCNAGGQGVSVRWRTRHAVRVAFGAGFAPAHPASPVGTVMARIPCDGRAHLYRLSAQGADGVTVSRRVSVKAAPRPDAAGPPPVHDGAV